MQKVYVTAAKRTAIGGFMGSLSGLHPSVYGAEVAKAVLEEASITPEKVDETIVGNILPAGLGQGLARQIAIKAGIPQEVPAYVVNMVCGSGMKSVMNAYANIRTGWHDLVMAGGVESMSQAPHILPAGLRKGQKLGGFQVKDHMVDDALTDAFGGMHMGITAENIAEKHSITREEQDQFALTSHERAAKAQDEGRFAAEIAPITVPSRRGDFVFSADEHINRETNLERLGKLRPAFKKDGTVTAGNASGINDGASFTLIAGEKAVRKHKLKPLVEIVGIGQAALDPAYMGLGPVEAIGNALENAGLSFTDIDLFEMNEAFAAQSIGVLKELSDKHGANMEDILASTNVNGGAIGLGHPIGSSGNRIIVTLIHEMKRRGSRYGLATLCIGGGMGTAVILKNMEENI